MTTPVLNYVSAINRPRVLTLESKAGTVRVTFPVPPMWACISTMVLYAMAGIMPLAMGIWFVASMHRLSGRFHIPPSSQPFFVSRRFLTQELLQWSVSALCWWSVAGYHLWRLLHWGRVPWVLTATSEGLVSSRLGLLRMRERTWPSIEIASIEARPLKYNLTWGRTGVDLLINRRKGRRLHYRLLSHDALLPNEIAEQFASALGCPLL